MNTHKIALLALCQFTRTCGATWRKIITQCFSACQNVLNTVGTTSISTFGLELRGLKFPLFGKFDPLLQKKLSTWENLFVTHRQRVSSSTIPEIFKFTAVIGLEQFGFKVVKIATGLIYSFIFAQPSPTVSGGSAI